MKLHLWNNRAEITFVIKFNVRVCLITAGSAIPVPALGQMSHHGSFYISLGKLPSGSLCWAHHVVQNIVTCSFCNTLDDFWHHRWKLWFKISKIFGKWTVSCTWKITVLMANCFSCCGICAGWKNHIDPESQGIGEFLSPCQIFKLSTNYFRKH